MDCIFCKIAAGEIPAKKLYEDEHALAFADINPQAPVHILIIPKRHIASPAQLEGTDADKTLIGHLHIVAQQLASQQNLGKGYRITINTGPDGGQTVDHLHLHLLGGRQMHWPPG
ncbi:MAG TPA: histidine triad nucleotide-binding protein [Acidobacteriaceae bacterium]|nr:histidine triad nucleotide-binding protein [Acidobacteriaceae bacterium]